MGISAKVLAYSEAPNGKRLITYEATYPRPIHSEVLTHKMLSRNSASSRAIPVAKMIQRVVDDPWIPTYIGANQRGMQAGEALPEADRVLSVGHWLKLRDHAVDHARLLADLKVHKQVVNRILEPWMWITTVLSATEWNNFFALRDHEAAEPHFQELARALRRAREEATPVKLAAGEWHLPYVTPEDREQIPADQLVKVSVGRVARVSYLTQDGRRDLSEDLALHDRLMVQRPLHASPAEHVAQAQGEHAKWSGNFLGFTQYRKTLAFENVPG